MAHDAHRPYASHSPTFTPVAMEARTVLAQCPLFEGLSAEALDRLAASAQPVEIASGVALFMPGSAPDCIYIVANGRLVASLGDGTQIGVIARLEPIGEIGALSGEPRTAAVHAVRDSLLFRIAADRLYALIHEYPEALIAMTRVIIQRLRRNQRAEALDSAQKTRSIAVVPATADADASMVARQLVAALSGYCAPLLVDAAAVDAALGPGAALARTDSGAANQRVVEHLNALEAATPHLVYLAGADADPWARRCMRQADRILMVTHARSPAIDSAMIDEWRRSGARAPVELLVIRPESVVAGAVAAWRERLGARAHYFVRPGHAADFASLARQLTGRGVGVVLGGGGARGFAHIGLMRAMAELKIPVDAVGGSSMGAFFAALIACGYDHHEQLHIARETFVNHNYLNDYIFPSVALIRGRKFLRRLRDIFEDRQIEDLHKPYFCVSTNLSRGSAMVHDRGPLHLWIAGSMAVPGVAPPLAYQGELLADGAVINSLPTDVMQSWARGPIIASDVSTAGGIAAPGVEGPDPEALFNWRGQGERPRLLTILHRTATLTSESGIAQRAARADLYLRMPVSKVALFDWKRFDEVVELGYQFALEQLQRAHGSLMR